MPGLTGIAWPIPRLPATTGTDSAAGIADGVSLRQNVTRDAAAPFPQRYAPDMLIKSLSGPLQRALLAIAAIWQAPAMAAGSSEAASMNTSMAIGAVLLTAGVLAVIAIPLRQRNHRRAARRRLVQTLKHHGSDVLEDLILPGAYEGLTRVHFAVLTPGGILCVQAKHCDGTIAGGIESPQWTCTGENHRHQFLNPVIQNAGHIKAISHVAPGVPIKSLVVVTGAAQFEFPAGDDVIHADDLDACISSWKCGQPDVPEIGDAWRALKASALTDAASRKDLDAQLSFG